MRICFITDLPVWSLGDGKGAPSFYNTIKIYNDKGDKVTLLTTEKNLHLSDLENVTVVEMNHIEVTHNRAFWGVFRLIHKYCVYFFQQRSGYRYLKQYAELSDIVYAYEIGFVPAVKKFSKHYHKRWVSRFQGTILTDLVQHASWFRKIKLRMQFVDHLTALKARSDLTIMTDDGTRGNQVLALVRGTSDSSVSFWKNGVDFPEVNELSVSAYKKNHNDGDIIFCSLSRIQKWKRLDRSLDIFEAFHKVYPNSHYYVIGDGEALLSVQKLASVMGLSGVVSFMGALQKPQIYQLLQDSKYFLSSYELSNLGNPLFEAICCSAIVATLDNGATGEIIVDQHTGIISQEESYLDNATKLIALEHDKILQNRLLISATEKCKSVMDTWARRMEMEYSTLVNILNDPQSERKNRMENLR